MKKTKYESFLSGKLPKGCKLCVKGKKTVLFVTGLCNRNCFFCPLSNARKNIDKIYANEKEIKNIKEIFDEIKKSKAKGCSLTGGDPLLKLDRTLKLASKIKKEFGKRFHIHIYLSTKLVNKNNLEKLSKYVDEIRFHPDLENSLEEEVKKIKLAKSFWKKKNIGIEIPCFPDKMEKVKKLILETKEDISFLNLNELETGEFSQKAISKKYKISKNGHTIKNSIFSGKKLILWMKRNKININIHLCTAELKNNYQYANRLKQYSKLKYSKKTKDGTFIYFATPFSKKSIHLIKNKLGYMDKQKNNIILNPKKINKLDKEISIYLYEEFPTSDREEIRFEKIK